VHCYEPFRIEETVLLYKGERDAPSRRMLTGAGRHPAPSLDLFGLDAYAPKR